MALFKHEYLDQAASDIATKVSVSSINCAAAVLAIWDLINKRFYQISLTSATELIRANLLKPDFISNQVSLSEEYQNAIAHPMHKQLETDFFRYFFARLRPMLKYTYPVNKPRINKQEIEWFLAAAFNTWYMRCPIKGKYLAEECRQINSLCHWYIRSDRRDNAIYDASWLWASIKNAHPLLWLEDSNEALFSVQILEGCFPMFWDALRGYYVQMILYCANFGWLAGDFTIQEMLTKRGKSKNL